MFVSFLDVNGEEVGFSEVGEVEHWLAKEREAFAWMRGKTGAHRLENLVQLYRGSWDEVAQSLSGGNANEIRSALSQKFGPNGKIFNSESRQGRFLCRVAAANQWVANSAASLLHGLEDGNRDSLLSLPVYQAAASAVGAFRASIWQTSRELESLRVRGDDLVARLEAADQSSIESKAHFQTQADALLSELRDSLAAAESRFEEESAELLKTAREEYEEQKKYFMTEIALLAPVEYWSSVARDTRRLAKGWGIAFGVLVGVLAVSLTIWSADLKSYLVETERESISIILAVAISSLAFWALRMTAKIFLSNYHRATDAAERETMVKTFLALRREQHVSNDVLSLVLAPMFRPGSSGLVKDDAAPEFSIAALLSRERK